MRDSEIKIGDVVKIRQWDDMVSEFGINTLGNIPIPQKITDFTSNMKRYCGEVFTVKSMYRWVGYEIGYRLEGRSGINRYFVTSEMLEHYDKPFDVASDDEIALLLS